MKANLLASDKEEVDGMSLVELADKYPEFLRGRISIEFDYIFMSDEEKAKKDYSYVRFNQLMNAEPIDWRDPDYAAKRNKYILETGKNPSTNEPATEAEIITAKNYGWVKAIPDTVAWTDMMVGSYVGHQVYNGKPIYGLDTDLLGRAKIPSSGNSSVVSRVEFENNSVPSVGKAQNVNLQFNSEQKLVNHFDKHSAEVAHALKRTDYSIEQYLKDANFVVETGTYVPELNAYVKFIGYEGKNTLYAFVGLDRNTGNITTYHVKTVDYLIKKAPSLGFER